MNNNSLTLLPAVHLEREFRKYGAWACFTLFVWGVVAVAGLASLLPELVLFGTAVFGLGLCCIGDCMRSLAVATTRGDISCPTQSAHTVDSMVCDSLHWHLCANTSSVQPKQLFLGAYADGSMPGVIIIRGLHLQARFAWHDKSKCASSSRTPDEV